MKALSIRFLGLLIMWAMIIFTTMQNNTLLWLLLAAGTFVVIHIVSKWTKVATKYYDGLKLHRFWFKWLAFGVALGGLYSIIRFFLLYNMGALDIVRLFPIPIDAVIVPIVILLISNCYIAFSEEIVFRGYLIGALPRKLHRGWSIFLSSLFFLLAHMLNDSTSIFRVIELLFLGMTLAVIYTVTKSLWSAIGLHFGLNFFFFLFGGDGDPSRQYVLLGRTTDRYINVMEIMDAILSFVLFLSIVLLSKKSVIRRAKS